MMILSPSLLGADFKHLKEEIARIERGGAKYLQPGRDGWSLRAKHFFWYAGAFFYQKLYRYCI